MEQENNVQNLEQNIEVNESLKTISEDLKSLIQSLNDENLREQELLETEKQLQIEAENQQKELDEQEEIEFLEKQKLDLEEKQLLQDSENEFRTNLVESLSLQNEKMDTYINNSDGLAESIETLNQNTSILVENTQVSEIEESNQTITYYAGLAVLVVVMIFIPSWIMVKFFSGMFRTILKAIL